MKNASQQVIYRKPSILHDYAEGKELNPEYTFMVTKERVDLADAMVRSKRFAGLNLSDYCSVLDKEVEKQFAAMIFSLPELDYQQIGFSWDR